MSLAPGAKVEIKALEWEQVPFSGRHVLRAASVFGEWECWQITGQNSVYVKMASDSRGSQYFGTLDAAKAYLDGAYLMKLEPAFNVLPPEAKQ